MNTSTDQLVSSQWLDRTLPSSADVPERRLLVAVLVDAVHCLQGGEKERAEALTWIRHGRGPARISYGVLCEALGLEPQPLIRRLLHSSVLPSSLDRRRPKGHRTVTAVDARAPQPPRTVPVSITG